MAAPVPSHEIVRVGVGVVLVNDKGQVLLGCRKGSHGAGKFALPGGHLEFGESWEQCAIREVEEEVGVTISTPRYVFCVNSVMLSENKHYITLFMQATFPDGKLPRTMEPHKCEGWLWADWANLPSPLFQPLEDAIKQGFAPVH
eukprot:jgi/Mesvir1/12456/Mv00610-RA.1